MKILAPFFRDIVRAFNSGAEAIVSVLEMIFEGAEARFWGLLGVQRGEEADTVNPTRAGYGCCCHSERI